MNKDNLFNFGGFYVLMILFFLLLYAAMGCNGNEEIAGSYKGVITTFGSELFVEVGIKTDDNTNYVLVTTAIIEDEMLKNQGHRCEVFYTSEAYLDGHNFFFLKK